MRRAIVVLPFLLAAPLAAETALGQLQGSAAEPGASFEGSVSRPALAVLAARSPTRAKLVKAEIQDNEFPLTAWELEDAVLHRGSTNSGACLKEAVRAPLLPVATAVTGAHDGAYAGDKLVNGWLGMGLGGLIGGIVGLALGAAFIPLSLVTALGKAVYHLFA